MSRWRAYRGTLGSRVGVALVAHRTCLCVSYLQAEPLRYARSARRLRLVQWPPETERRRTEQANVRTGAKPEHRRLGGGRRASGGAAHGDSGGRGDRGCRGRRSGGVAILFRRCCRRHGGARRRARHCAGGAAGALSVLSSSRSAFWLNILRREGTFVVEERLNSQWQTQAAG